MRLEGRQEGLGHLEPGPYFWKVTKAEHQYSKNGDEQFVLTLLVGNQGVQAEIKEFLTFSEKAYWRVEAFLKSAGMYAGDGVDIHFEALDCVGLHGSCTVKDEPGRNDPSKTYSRIDRWLEANNQNPNPAWIERARKPTEQGTSYSSSDPAGDDIPF
jgi:hypothetical protein